MSDLLGISGNAVMAYQRALGTVSNNIANVGTDGYSRQDVTLLAGSPRQIGNASIGTGVIFDRVQRQYDAFAESNLRNSNSELQSQAPMVEYANRVIDVMGAESMGLVSALDQFFASARTLSSNPASTVLRGAFVRDAEGLTSRFGLLSTQLDLIDTETREAVQSSVGEINTLAQQLGQVNRQLSKMPTLEKQPSELLDQRDLLLRKLSEFSRINTSFNNNGQVLVSLGASLTQDVIVDGSTVTQIGADFNAASSGKIGLQLDPYGDPKPLVGITSGQLAGLMAFREQVLGSTRNSLDFLANTLVREVNAIHREGIDGYGDPAGDLFAIDPAASTAAGGIKVVIDDPMRIAAADRFRVIKDSRNTGSADARISFQPSPLAGPADISTMLLNNAHPSAARPLVLDASRPVAAVASIPSGQQDVTIYLDGADAGQQLQVITRDGRHLMGQSLTETQQDLMLTPDQGVSAGASYSAAYLNRSGLSGYKGMSVFYGARASVQTQALFDTQGQFGGASITPGLLSGARIPASQAGGIAAGAISINGVPLGSIYPTAGNTLQASDLARWVNAGAAVGVIASASNDIRVPASSLQLSEPLYLNQVEIVGSAGAAGFTSADDLVNAINSQSANTGVTASISSGNELVLTNVSGQEGNDIRIAPSASGNALNMAAGVYAGRLSIARSSGSTTSDPIALGYGPNGQPADLARLGFPVSMPAVLSGARLPVGQAVSIAAGALELNGVSLGRLAIAADDTSRATQIAAWLNAAHAPGVGATASNEIRVKASSLNLSGSLTLSRLAGGAALSLGPYSSADALVAGVNANTGTTGVKAVYTREGDIVLNNLDGADITIGPDNGSPGNALNIASGTYTGQVTVTRSLVGGKDTPVEISFGTGGTPFDLAQLGFRTSATIKGTVPDDVLVFVTGTGTAAVAASFSGGATDKATSLRAQPMELTFTAADRYTITDTRTGTVLAERSFDPNQRNASIEYQGLKVSFTTSPKTGDRFLMDGNKDGTGNNENMLRLAALESAGLVAGKTIGSTYIDHVNDMGNISRQANIAQEALTVVHDQAVAARDKVSGVSLDEEAANLIRYQQAYQASAKVMQVATVLFDAVLAVR
jgi:flagellar hook-associated protein FlgK